MGNLPRESPMPRGRSLFPVLLLICGLVAVAGPALRGQVAAGPMVGAVDMREAQLWTQLDGEGQVQFRYWPEGKPDAGLLTAPVRAVRENGFAVTAVADRVEAGFTYEYAVLVDGREVPLPRTLSFSTPPFYRDREPPPDFRVVAATGNYVNDEPYDPPFRKPGGDFGVYETILSEEPALMLWLGNAVHLREADWGSRSGVLKRYGHSRAFGPLQPLLGRVSHVGAWGRHEYGPPGADKSLWNAGVMAEGFELFWPNPSHGVAGIDGQITKLRWSDAEFYLLDGQTHRDVTARRETDRQVLGEAQLDWLLNSLERSTAAFKVVMLAMPVLNPVSEPHHLAMAPRERDRLLDSLLRRKTGGVVFVSGGMPYGQTTRIPRPSAPDIVDVNLGPLTARPGEEVDRRNFFAEPGTTHTVRQYALLEFTGPEDARKLVITVKSSVGKTLSSVEFGPEDLAPPE